MAKPPAYQFYPKDCDTDEKVRGQDDREFGFFVRCLNHSWLNVGLPAELPELARVLGRSVPYVKKLWGRVGPCFVAVEGRLYNPKQEKYRAELLSKSESGRVAAERRWKKIRDASASIPHGIPHCVGNALHYVDADAVVKEDSKKKPVAQSSEEFDFSIWFEAQYERHPKKRHKHIAASYLMELPQVHDLLWRQEFERVHKLWIATESWQWKNGSGAPELSQWILDEGWKYAPIDSPPTPNATGNVQDRRKKALAEAIRDAELREQNGEEIDRSRGDEVAWQVIQNGAISRGVRRTSRPCANSYGGCSRCGVGGARGRRAA